MVWEWSLKSSHDFLKRSHLDIVTDDNESSQFLLLYHSIFNTSWPTASEYNNNIDDILRFSLRFRHNIITTLTAFSGKRNATVWCPSVRLSVPSPYSPWLARDSMRCSQSTFRMDSKEDRHSCWCLQPLVGSK